MKLELNLGKEYYKRSASPQDLRGPVSKSLLWAFNQSPYKWAYGARESSGATPAMELGSLIHCMALTPHLLDSEYIVSGYDAFRTNESKAWKEDQEAQGISVITAKTWGIAHAATKELKAQWLYPTNISPEVAVFGEIDGVEIKGMIDIVPTLDSPDADSLFDLKTTASIDSEDALQRLIINRGYHWQAALYLDLYNAATGGNRDSFVFIFLETSSPYETAFVRITTDFIEQGRKEYRKALARWKTCVELGNFPKKIEGMTIIDIPTWMKTNL
jgi:hypothetical protein